MSTMYSKPYNDREIADALRVLFAENYRLYPAGEIDELRAAAEKLKRIQNSAAKFLELK